MSATVLQQVCWRAGLGQTQVSESEIIRECGHTKNIYALMEAVGVKFVTFYLPPQPCH